MQNPELFACLSKERKENLLGTLLFRPSIYERLYYEEEMVRKQIVCYEEFLQIVRNPQIRAAAPEIDFEFEEFSANSYLSLVDEYLYWNKVPGDILLRLKKAAEDDRFAELKNKFEQVEAELKDDTQTNLETYRKQVIEAINNDIVMRYGYQAGVIEHSLPGDKEVKQAIGVLENPEEYARITREQDTQRK